MQTIERVLILALIRDMRTAGYQPAAVWDGEAHVLAKSANLADGLASFDAEPRMLSSQPTKSEAPANILRPLTDDEALQAIDTVDESTLHFTDCNATTWGGRGVLIILGNGEDCLSDYHVAKGEPFGGIIERIYDRISDGHTP
jgi:hypothetical protein